MWGSAAPRRRALPPLPASRRRPPPHARMRFSRAWAAFAIGSLALRQRMTVLTRWGWRTPPSSLLGTGWHKFAEHDPAHLGLLFSSSHFDQNVFFVRQLKKGLKNFTFAFLRFWQFWKFAFSSFSFFRLFLLRLKTRPVGVVEPPRNNFRENSTLACSQVFSTGSISHPSTRQLGASLESIQYI